MNQTTRSLAIGLTATILGAAATPAAAQRMSGQEAISALQNGGYVLVMREAPASLEAARSSGRGGGFGFGGGGRRGGGAPAPEPTEEALEPMSAAMLTGMRHAIWTFDIRVGAIYTSPTRRTREHAEEVPFVEITVVDELSLDEADSGWLAGKLAETPTDDSNTIIVTHSPNIENDLGIGNVGLGETLIVRPGAEPEVVGRLGLREWSVLAIELGG
ncbi:MAG TPA: hypothetical protein VIV64_03415 [Gammaproteobacteria bacterium]|jgi:hypothetical protein